jgi:hypothetical protein
MFRTRFGLRIRAVGENPGAVDTAGISVAWLRYRALICTGILCGLAGAYLSMAHWGRLREGHDRRASGYHRARCAHLRQVEAGAGDVRLPALWLPRRDVDPPPGIAAALCRQACQRSSCRPCPTSSPSSCSPASSASAIPPRAGGVPYVKER